MGRFLLATLSLLVGAFSLNEANSCCCPQDWLPRNGFCYKVFNDPKNWNDAEMFCRKFKPGCHLASIHSNADSADLAEYVSDYLKSDGHVWIGLKDPRKQRTWVWSDRSPTNYYAWNQGEPNNSKNTEYCVQLWALSGYLKWNDERCESLYPFICQCKF